MGRSNLVHKARLINFGLIQYQEWSLSVPVTRNEQFPGKRLSQTNAESSPECLEHERAEVRSTRDGDSLPEYITTFIKRLIKVLVARNLFLVHSSSCRNNKLLWKPLCM